MIAARTAPAAYWATGGTLMSRRGALGTERALSLFRFYGLQAQSCGLQGDRSGARHCASQALHLARALVAAEDWGRAAGARTRAASTLNGLRNLIRDLNSELQS